MQRSTNPADLDLGSHLGKLEAGILEVRHRLAERLALASVVERPLQGRLGRRQRADTDGQALLRQLLHQVDESLAVLAEQVLPGNPHILEEQLGGVLGLHPDLLQALALAEARRTRLDHEQAYALGASLRIGLRHHDHQVGEEAVGDEGLRAIDDVLVAIQYRRGLHPLQVGTGPGSVMAMAATISPDTSFGRYLRFSASLP